MDVSAPPEQLRLGALFSAPPILGFPGRAMPSGLVRTCTAGLAGLASESSE